MTHRNDPLINIVVGGSDLNVKVGQFYLTINRRKHSSTIFCSQFLESDWYERLSTNDSPIADAIMDRISYDSYKIDIESIDPKKDISMREVYGLDPSLAK